MRRILFILIMILSCAVNTNAQLPDASILQKKAPEQFKAIFKTSKGEFTIESNRKWSPMGVDRLYQLIVSGFFNTALLFRVEPGYLVHFGIAKDEKTNRFWDPKKIPDEPAMIKNTKGTISFVYAKKNGRATQLFVNMADNIKFDTTMRDGVRGYTPVARVIKGMDVVTKFESRHGRMPALVQDSLYKYGNSFFNRYFPGLDYVISARIVK